MGIVYIEDIQSQKQVVIFENTQCPICKKRLGVEIEHLPDNKVKEELRCSECLALSSVLKHVVH